MTERLADHEIDLSELAPRPLISRKGVLALVTTAGATLVALGPLARERDRLAQHAPTSALSLGYMRIALQERPDDPALRLSLAAAEQGAGNTRTAESLLAPLLGRDDATGRRALEKQLELERSLLAATPEADTELRDRLRQRAAATVHTLATRADASDAEVHRAASVLGELDLPARRAQLLTLLIARSPAAFAAHAAEAEAALTAAGDVAAAAKLAERRALLARSRALALHALDLAVAADDAPLLRSMAKRMARTFPRDAVFVERELGAALSAGDLQRALVLAKRMRSEFDDTPERRRAVRDIALWVGDDREALAAQLDVAKTGERGELERAVSLAEQQSNLPVLARLLAQRARRGASGPREVLGRARVLEALGEPAQALTLLEQAARGPHAGEHEVWRRAVAVARALGDTVREDALLHGMDERFGYQLPHARRRAQLALRMGRRREALHTLAAIDDGTLLARAAALAWDDDDLSVARVLYRQRTQRTDAEAVDFYRLSVLESLMGDERSGLRVALAAYRRFRTPELGAFALSAGLSARDADVRAGFVAASADPGHPFHHEPALVAERVSAQQQLAAQAVAQGRLEDARHMLQVARRELSGAGRREGLDAPRAEQLEQGLLAVEWDAAVRDPDTRALARLYPQFRPKLSAREQVFVLARMGERDKALDSALVALRQDRVDDTDRPALVRDAEAMAGRRVRELRLGAELSHVGPLNVQRTQLGVTYDGPRLGLLVGAGYGHFSIADDAGFDTSRPHDVSAYVGVHVPRNASEARAVVGMDTRSGQVARPFLDTRLSLRLGPAETAPAPELGLALRANETATDSPALQVLGVRDELGASLTVPVTRTLYAAASATGSIYSARSDRTLLGGGITAEAALGANLGDHATPLRGNVRLFGRAAPRFRRNDGALPENVRALSATPAGSAVPDSTSFVGVGASAARGDYSLPPLDKKRFAFLLDGAVGVLVPQRKVGFSGRAGVGVSVLGEDMLSVSARASNVAGVSTPGSATWAVSAEYAVNLWK